MQPLQQRNAQGGVEHHARNPVRVYTEDGIQAERIERSVSMALAVLGTLGDGPHRVVELGCGTADICGQLAATNDVIGVDCNLDCILKAKERWFPYGTFLQGMLEHPDFDVAPDGDLLILCELLEHLEDPGAFVKKWLPRFRTCLISHPIDGDLTGDMSGGDHAWSLNMGDHLNWFAIGGHEMQVSEEVRVGSYRLALSWGRRL